ncbi:DNA-processing protein DprA [Williamsoniiplasma lucivorax]|uniref:DNA processing/uptake protein n=1 Tax=Williamsoniiplasma lucivorax TaxID=209274 RepID=A0A2S5RDK9_9MOLU|nr:DNA-processing protein DprA [Williamsoniiplasma lucivorax]PPE05400.1 DNA processing/uptake protein [Williamsoniiplasma lucivorax]
MNNVLLYFSLKYKGDWEKVYEALEKKEKITNAELKKIESKIDCNYLTIIDQYYPVNLKYSYKPPFLLYTQGDLGLLKNYSQTIGIDIETTYDEDGVNNTSEIINNLIKENKTIVSGFATMSEKSVVQTAIDHNSKIIIVVEEGIENFKDSNQELMKKMEQSKNWLVVSESYQNNQLNETTSEYVLRLKVGLTKTLVCINNSLFNEKKVDDLKYDAFQQQKLKEKSLKNQSKNNEWENEI